MKREAEQTWAAERVENALLRERINDVAAEVARLTAALEGPGSPIDAILAASTPRRNPAPTARRASRPVAKARAVSPIASAPCSRASRLPIRASATDGSPAPTSIVRRAATWPAPIRSSLPAAGSIQACRAALRRCHAHTLPKLPEGLRS